MLLLRTGCCVDLVRAQAKEGVDKLNLNFQSLHYEKSHFLKEISICRDFTYDRARMLPLTRDVVPLRRRFS